jgi:hypothetical protein
MKFKQKIKQKLGYLKTNWFWILFGTWFLSAGFYGMAGAAIARAGIIQTVDAYGNTITEHTSDFSFGTSILMWALILWAIESVTLLAFFGYRRIRHPKLT